MRKTSGLLRTCLLAFLTFVCTHAAARAQNPCAPSAPKTAAPLASETVVSGGAEEFRLDIEARSPGADWARKGAEAAALVVTVDGAYNQHVLLWAGEEFYHYRVLLGRLPKGRHKISLAFDEERSAAGARRAEVRSLKVDIPFAFISPDPAGHYFAVEHAPVLYARPNTIDHFTDIPLLMYYEVLPEGAETLYRYTVVFTNEDGGTQTAALFARWGRGTDIEWVYEVRVQAGKVVAETFQGVQHETKNFKGQRTSGEHPLLAVASDNNNFSDLACSAVRFAPFPIHMQLEAATRESVMDSDPVTYRAMTQELQREGRISDSPSDINTIADPRDYLYVEAASEQADAAIAFDVKLKGRGEVFKSDMNDPRLRIERSGNYRTGIRLPKGFSVGDVESVTARCHPHPVAASGGTCRNLKLLRVLVLTDDFKARALPFEQPPAISLNAGETKRFRPVP